MIYTSGNISSTALQFRWTSPPMKVNVSDTQGSSEGLRLRWRMQKYNKSSEEKPKDDGLIANADIDEKSRDKN